jgi:curved DNA-binding protein CbpA
VLQRGPVPAQRPGGPAAPAGGTRGLAAREVTAAAAIAAGLDAEGALAREGPLHLYYLAAACQATGRLVLGSELATYGLTFKKGAVEHASSTWPQDDLGEFLVRRGVLTTAQAADAREIAPRLGGDLLAALVELRALDPAARFQDLQEHGAGLVWRALALEAGTWRWEPGAAVPPYAFPLGSRWGLFCDAVRRLDGPGLQRRLGARSGRPAERVGGRVDLSELRLKPQEARVAGLFDGARSPDEIAAGQGSDADAVRRVALLLAEAELLRFGAPVARPAAAVASPAGAEPGAGKVTAAPAPSHAPVPGAPAAPSRVPAPAAARAAPSHTPVPGANAPAPATARAAPSHTPTPGPSALARAAARAAPSHTPVPGASAPARPPARLAPTVESLRATLERLREADHFQALGVPREADGARIKAAYFQMAKTYHPDTTGEGEPEEARKLRADIFARMGAAWAVLEDDARRAEYRQELQSGLASQVDIAAILRAEEIFEKVPALAQSRSYPEALRRVNEAIALYPDEPEYGVWRAWLEFLLAPDGQKKAQRISAERAIEAAVRKSPKCRPAWLFLGRMAKLTGDAAAAERQLKRGLAELPDDPELLQELRFARK